MATENPFEGVLKIGDSKTKVAATPAEAYALEEGRKGIGEPRQRQDLVRNYRSALIQVTSAYSTTRSEREVQPLEDKGRKLFPEVEEYLTDLPRLGVAIVATKGLNQSFSTLRHGLCASESARSSGVGRSWIARVARRNGGMTQVGSAELPSKA